MSLQYENDLPSDEAEIPPRADSGESAPIAYYTYILMAAIAAVMIAQFASGLEGSILIAGFVKPAFLLDGEYWRIVTGAALHGSILHVVMNGYALYSFGSLMEMLSNRAHLALVFLLSAIGGGLLSLFFAPDGISVGASGGIVGLIGYLAIYAFRRRQFISAEFRRSLLTNIAFILIFGLVLYQVIDNYGHIGGLLTGVIYGFAQIPKDAYTDPRSARSVTRILGAAALGIYLAAAVLSIFLIVRAA